VRIDHRFHRTPGYFLASAKLKFKTPCDRVIAAHQSGENENIEKVPFRGRQENRFTVRCPNTPEQSSAGLIMRRRSKQDMPMKALRNQKEFANVIRRLRRMANMSERGKGGNDARASHIQQDHDNSSDKETEGEAESIETAPNRTPFSESTKLENLFHVHEQDQVRAAIGSELRNFSSSLETNARQEKRKACEISHDDVSGHEKFPDSTKATEAAKSKSPRRDIPAPGNAYPSSIPQQINYPATYISAFTSRGSSSAFPTHSECNSLPQPAPMRPAADCFPSVSNPFLSAMALQWTNTGLLPPPPLLQPPPPPPPPPPLPPYLDPAAAAAFLHGAAWAASLWAGRAGPPPPPPSESAYPWLHGQAPVSIPIPALFPSHRPHPAVGPQPPPAGPPPPPPPPPLPPPPQQQPQCTNRPGKRESSSLPPL
jgi:hypothetical protein